MDELVVTYENISSNANLTDSLKENFKELITIFHQNFKEVSLDNFNERIKGLDIKKGSKYLLKDAITYKPMENTLYINEEELNKVDAKHELMYALLTIITAKDNYFGFDTDGTLTVLNVGLTEMIANFLVGNESE
jgi:hypothetical protein